MAELVLSPSEADGATNELSYKRGTIYFGGARDFKIVFTLLTKVIAFHVRLTLIDLWGPSF